MHEWIEVVLRERMYSLLNDFDLYTFLSCNSRCTISSPVVLLLRWHLCAEWSNGFLASAHARLVFADSYHIVSHCQSVQLSCFHTNESLPLPPSCLSSFSDLLPVFPSLFRPQSTSLIIHCLTQNIRGTQNKNRVYGLRGELTLFMLLQNWNQEERSLITEHSTCMKCPHCLKDLRVSTTLQLCFRGAALPCPVPGPGELVT